MPKLIEKDGLHLALLVADAAGPRDQDLALLLELLDRRDDSRPRLSERLDGESAAGGVPTDEREEVGLRRQVEVRLQRGAGSAAQSAEQARSGTDLVSVQPRLLVDDDPVVRLERLEQLRVAQERLDAGADRQVV